MVCDMEGYTYGRFNVLAICLPQCAAKNRNAGLDIAKSEIVIMVDDDVRGFHENWADLLIEPLSDPDIIMVSARLYRPDGKLAYTMGESFDVSKPLDEAKNKKLPTACVAFRNDGTRFYEGFVSSGFEDTWFCECLNRKYPNGKYVTNNSVKLVHLNEKKGQMAAWNTNSAIFNDLMSGKIKWP
jgi:glycosyltransferase involved in cell wall biosynthesis